MSISGLPGGTVVKNSPMQETQETWVQSLGQEDPLEKEMTTCSSILAWETHRGAWWGPQESDMTQQQCQSALKTIFSFLIV